MVNAFPGDADPFGGRDDDPSRPCGADPYRPRDVASHGSGDAVPRADTDGDANADVDAPALAEAIGAGDAAVPSLPADPAFDQDDPEPDVLPGGGWVSFDLSARQGPGRSSDSGSPPAAASPPLTPRPHAETTDRTVARAVAGVLVVWRMHRGLRQRDVAPLFGVTQAQLSRLERGRATVSIELLGRVVEVTGSRIDVTVVPLRAGRAVDRTVHDGLQGERRVQVVVDGPSARGSRPPRGRRPGRGRRTRAAGPFS